jgi:hypothetical protein
MRNFVRLFAETAPWIYELLCAELTPERVLTSFTLLNLVVASMAAHRIASATTAQGPTHQIHALLLLWATSCISILVWTICSILLHLYQVF